MIGKADGGDSIHTHIIIALPNLRPPAKHTETMICGLCVPRAHGIVFQSATAQILSSPRVFKDASWCCSYRGCASRFHLRRAHEKGTRRLFEGNAPLLGTRLLFQ